MCEFRAGKMSLEGTRVVPDTRKGLVRIGRVCMLSFLCISSTIYILSAKFPRHIHILIFIGYSSVIICPLLL